MIAKRLKAHLETWSKKPCFKDLKTKVFNKIELNFIFLQIYKI